MSSLREALDAVRAEMGPYDEVRFTCGSCDRIHSIEQKSHTIKDRGRRAPCPVCHAGEQWPRVAPLDDGRASGTPADWMEFYLHTQPSLRTNLDRGQMFSCPHGRAFCVTRHGPASVTLVAHGLPRCDECPLMDVVDEATMLERGWKPWVAGEDLPAGAEVVVDSDGVVRRVATFSTVDAEPEGAK